MRIETTLPPQTLGFPTPSADLGQGASFDTLYAPPHAGDQTPPVRTLSPALQNVLSFDAPGMLGLGGTVTNSRTAKPRAEDVKTATPQNPAIPVTTAPSTGLAATHPARDVSALTPGAEAATAPMPISVATMGTARSASQAGQPHVAAVTTSSPGSALPAPSGGPAALEIALPPNGRPTVSHPAYSATRGPVADAPPVPRKASSASHFEMETEPASGEVSVTLSENDGILTIAAAAPELSEDDRQTLKSLTDDVAVEAGMTVGELRLNGVPLRAFSKLS